MSIHRSLVSKSNLGRSRNVLTRYERIIEMRKLGNWDEEEGNPYGLPKVKVLKIKKRSRALTLPKASRVPRVSRAPRVQARQRKNNPQAAILLRP